VEKVQKTVLLSDSHTRCFGFVNWLAAEKKVLTRRLQFSKPNNTNDQRVGYVDFNQNGVAHRVVGIELDAISEPIVLPVLRDPHAVAFLLTKPTMTALNAFIKIGYEGGRVFKDVPRLQCLLGKQAATMKDEIVMRLADASLKASCIEVDEADFKAMWATLESGARVTKQTNVQVVQPPVHIRTNDPSATRTPTPGELNMANANETLNALMQIDGALGCLLADYTSGMLLAKAGGGVNLDVAAAGNSEVIKSKMKTMAALGLKETIEDILITLGTQYHIVRPMASKPGLFVYLVLDKAKSNLAMARYKVLEIEKALVV
jgi:hypothetical protein